MLVVSVIIEILKGTDCLRFNIFFEVECWCCRIQTVLPAPMKATPNMHNQAPEIFQRPLATIALPGLPLEGDFSGLQLLCYMHVGMALFDAKVDCGSGLKREYEMAKGLSHK